MKMIKSVLDGGVYSISMNRPEKKNAINLEMYIELKDAIKYADESDDIKVLVLSGEGGCFTSGNDLSDFLNFPEKIEENPAMQFIDAIANAKKPIVAAVSGLAIGIGVTMLLHCDIVIASKNTVFQMPFVNLGLCPEAGSTFLLPNIVGYQKAAKLVLTGDTFNAEEAYEMGIVSYLVEDDGFTNFSQEVAKKIAQKPKIAIMTTKRLLKAGFKDRLLTFAELESKEFLSLLKSKEVVSNIKAFLNR